MRRDDQRLTDIVEALDWIAKAIRGGTEPDFLADETLCYAIAQRLIMIGEAMARLSPASKARDASVPWQDVVGLRNIRVHEYFGIYWPLVWQTAVEDAPVLRNKIAAIREKAESDRQGRATRGRFGLRHRDINLDAVRTGCRPSNAGGQGRSQRLAPCLRKRC